MKRRTTRTIVVWIALLLLIASWWFFTYVHPWMGHYYGPDWRMMITNLTIIALAAGFLFTFRGGNDQ